MKAPSCAKIVNMFTCTTMYDLFVRLATFSNLKDEATSCGQKVVKPLLQLMEENGPVAEKAVDLLGLLMKLFPSSIYRHFNRVESVIAAKILSGQCNLQQSRKLASTLALLPCVRASQNSMSLMIQKILIVVNSMLNNFLGLEEGHTDHELMKLLTPPGSKSVPTLGGQTTYGDGQIHSTKKFCAYVVPTISALVHCCSVMLTSSYPIQVINVPVRTLITLIQKVLSVDGSWHKSLCQSNTPLCQEIICSEIPTLHSTFLDLLASTIKGMRSSLIPHAGIVVMLIVEYFERAKLPAIRRKLYAVVQLLLSSMGIGIAMQLLQVVFSNIFTDLDDTSSFSVSTALTEAKIWSSSKSSSNKKQTQQLQSSTVVSFEPTCNRQMMAPLCVKIAALETLQVLLNVGGGSFRACSWRTEMDLLLIDVARNACYRVGMYEQRPTWTEEDPSISDFQLASFKALLASLLSNPHERPPYFEQGLELFSRGKLETGTELAIFCSHALLALDVLIHPRQLPPNYVSKGVARHDLGLGSGAPEQLVLGSERSQPPCSVRKRRATNDLGDECKYRPVSTAKVEIDAFAKDSAVEKHTPVKLSRDLSLQKDAKRSCVITGEHPDIATYCLPEKVQAVSASSRTDVKMADGSCSTPAGLDTSGNPPASFSVHPPPIFITSPDACNFGDETSNKKCGHQGGILSGDASSTAPPHTSRIPAAPSVSGSKWDSLDPLLLNIGDC